MLFIWATTGLLALSNSYNSGRSIVVNRMIIYACPYSGQSLLELTAKITDDVYSGCHFTPN